MTSEGQKVGKRSQGKCCDRLPSFLPPSPKEHIHIYRNGECFVNGFHLSDRLLGCVENAVAQRSATMRYPLDAMRESFDLSSSLETFFVECRLLGGVLMSAIPPLFERHERLAVFIDGHHLHWTSRNLGVDIDYKSFRNFFASRSSLLRMFYYTIIVETEDYSPIRPLTDWLQYNGYHVVTKPGRDYVDSAGRRRVRGDIDVDLVVDMIEVAPYVRHIVLVAGSGDLVPACRHVQARGVRLSLLSTLKVPQIFVSDELRRQADQFIELADIVGEFTRRSFDPSEVRSRSPHSEAGVAPFAASNSE